MWIKAALTVSALALYAPVADSGPIDDFDELSNDVSSGMFGDLI